jgi:hypothetical protein
LPSAVGFFHGADASDEVCKALCGGLILSINKGKGESVLPDICKNYVIYYVVLDHRIMEVRRFFYKRLVFSDNRCSNRFFLVSAGIFVG